MALKALARKPQYGRRIAAACQRCDEIFTRRVVDLGPEGALFCSKRCHSATMRTGRRMAEVVCNGCGTPFKKLPSEVKRCRRNFCKPECYLASIDHAARGRAGGLAPKSVPRVARFLRSQKGGIARARALSPERQREIAMMGVAARISKKATRGPFRRVNKTEIQLGLQWFGPLLKREGS